MSAAAHTPGPWMVLPETGTGRIGQFCILTEHGPRLDIASTYGWPGTPIEANAHLIAAAPDLLAAARKVLDGLNLRLDHAAQTGAPSPIFFGIADLHAAIAKAEGRS